MAQKVKVQCWGPVWSEKVGCGGWISSRSGELLELLTELIILFHYNHYQYYITEAQVGGRSREGQTLRSVFSFDLATTTWKRFHTAIFSNLCFFYIFAPKASWHEGGTMVPWGCGDRWTLSFSILHWEMNFLPFCYTLRDEFVALLVHIERWISMSRWQTLRGGGLRSTWLRWISWAWIFSSWRPAWTTRSTS